MYKATAKDVKHLIEWGKDDEQIKVMMQRQIQPPLHEIAYYAPSNANWAWHIGLVEIGGKVYELLTRFGVVEGGRQIHLIKY